MMEPAVPRPFAWALAAAALLGGCALGPDFQRPAAPPEQRYTDALVPSFAAGGVNQQVLGGAPLRADWWRLFQSDALDAAVGQALARNPTLATAEATLRQSQANVRAGEGVFFPQISLGLSAARQRSGPLEQGAQAPGTIYDVVTLSGSISYVLDLFGGQRRAVESLRAQAEAQQHAYRAARLALTANVVNTAIARAAYQAQIATTQQLLARQQQQLALLEVQVRSGTLPYSAVLALRSQIALNRGTLAPLEQHQAQATHLLATLLGAAPAQSGLPAPDLLALTLPSELPLQLPSELVRQRPDILAAEAQMHAASAEIGVATAAMFPSISLSGSYGHAAHNFAGLSGDQGRFWSIGPSLELPLFRGGALWYDRQAAIAAWQAAQGNYRQTVLAAFAQVADALDALDHDARQLDAELENRRAAQQALDLMQANYQAGLVAQADVLGAAIARDQASVLYLQALALRHQDTVALFAAVGGGWWNAPQAPAAEPPR